MFEPVRWRGLTLYLTGEVGVKEVVRAPRGQRRTSISYTAYEDHRERRENDNSHRTALRGAESCGEVHRGAAVPWRGGPPPTPPPGPRASLTRPAAPPSR